MPYDPSKPADHSPLDSSEMRGQLTGLFDLIQAVPAGPPGAQGPPGASVSGAVVDSVTTVGAGQPAAASASYDGANLHFSFGIPRGTDGTNGLNGNDGMPGPAGTPGVAVTGAIVDFTNTANPGQPASASASFDGATVRFIFTIPRGADGANGIDGSPGTPGLIGPTGPQGIQGFDGPQGMSGATGPQGAGGPQGPQGPTGVSVTGAIVDFTTTTAPGTPASATVSFDGAMLRFNFSIPQGAQGNQGIQGPQGEVTNAALAAAIAGTSGNSNGVATQNTPFADPDAEANRQKINELILALRR